MESETERQESIIKDAALSEVKEDLTKFLEAREPTRCGSQSQGKVVKVSEPETSMIPQGNPSTRTCTYDLCPVCSAPGVTSCRSCKKTSYCGKAHQKSHWKEHKPGCFPIIEHEDPILGRRLIASRNIKQGEVILREQPWISGFLHSFSTDSCKIEDLVESWITTTTTTTPGFPSLLPCTFPEPILIPKGYAAGSNSCCLGCYKPGITSDYLCSACLWPVCGPKCEKCVDHSENECKVFTSLRLKPDDHTLKDVSCEEIYQSITILRGVLIKDLWPEKWSRLVDLDECLKGFKTEDILEEEIPVLDEDQRIVSMTYHFIHEICNLPQVSIQDIALVWRILRTSFVKGLGLMNFGDGNFCRDESHFYPVASLANHSCIPNTTWGIQSHANEICFRTAVPIMFGERITISYVDRTLDTLRRQQKLCQRRLPICSCKRCSDPSELGTFLAGVKCQRKSCTGTSLPQINCYGSWRKQIEGYVEWKCDACGCSSKTHLGDELKMISKKPYEKLSLVEGHLKGNASVNGGSEQHFEVDQLYKNNYLVYRTEMQVMRTISDQLERNVGFLFDTENYCSLARRQISYCQKWVEIADIIWPGYNEIRGQLLYFLQQAMLYDLVVSISSQMKNRKRNTEAFNNAMDCDYKEKTFLQVLSYRREVLHIFALHLLSSYGGKLAESMVDVPLEIVVLKRYFQSLNKH